MESIKQPPISMKSIRRMAAQIARQYQPEEIILFGPYAYGKPTTASDVDLLVVMDAPKGEIETALEITSSLHPLPYSVDVLVRSRQVLEHRKQLGDWFLREITQKGKVLYARTNR